MDDLRSGAARELVDHSNHPDVAGGRAHPELPCQRSGEGGQPAFSRRVRGEESVAHGHRRTASWLEGRRLFRRGEASSTLAADCCKTECIRVEILVYRE